MPTSSYVWQRRGAPARFRFVELHTREKLIEIIPMENTLTMDKDQQQLIVRLENSLQKRDTTNLFIGMNEALGQTSESILEFVTDNRLETLPKPRKQALADIIEKYGHLLTECSNSSRIMRKQASKHKIILIRLLKKLNQGQAIDDKDRFDIDTDEKEVDNLGRLSEQFRELATMINVEQGELAKLQEEAKRRFRMFVGIAISAAAVLVVAAVVTGIVLSGGIAAVPVAAVGAVAASAAATSTGCCASAVLALSIAGAVASFGILSASTAAACSCSVFDERTKSLQASYDTSKEECMSMAKKIIALQRKLDKLVEDKKLINEQVEGVRFTDLSSEISQCLNDQNQFLKDLNNFDETITIHETEYVAKLISIQTMLERPEQPSNCIIF